MPVKDENLYIDNMALGHSNVIMRETIAVW